MDKHMRQDKPLLPRHLEGLAQLAPQYDAVLCDVWGVVHNGLRAWEGAVDALTRFRAQGGKVLLVSNAPRPSQAVQDKLASLDVPQQSWDFLLTSGDMTQHILRTEVGSKPVFHLGPVRDKGLYDLADRQLNFVAEAEADIILLSGLWDDRTETPADYVAQQKNWLERKQRVLCANPDRQVQIGDQLVYCAGALAEQYEAMGGEVTWLGKPYTPIYARAQAMLGTSNILAIGDGLATDIQGANRAGLDVIFILGGLPALQNQAMDSPKAVGALLAQAGCHALGYMPHLVWA